MRKRILLSSVQKRLRSGERAELAAYMWNRHRLMVPFLVASFIVLTAVATAAGFETWAGRVAIGFAGAAVAGTASTDYRILAKTDKGFVLLKSSRVRQYATQLIEQLPASTPLERVGGTMLATEWIVGERSYTVAKSSEPAMSAMAGSGTP